MWRGLIVLLLLAGLAGCSKPPDLPATVVRAADAGELAGFRAELGAHFPADRLQAFDTALQELRLDAMRRDVAPAEAREGDMQVKVNGRTVREAEVLGWQARRARILSEIQQMTGLYEGDLKARQQAAAAGRPESVAVSTHLQNEQDILDRLRRDLADTEQRLAAWSK